MFTVVTIGGKQYKVAVGDRVVVSKLAGNVGDSVTFDTVKLLFDGTATKIGAPTVAGAKVTAKVVAQGKGEKIDVRRFKSKVRERRHVGFRPMITTLEITGITA